MYVQSSAKETSGESYEFLDYLSDFLERQSRQNLNIYIMGDFNIDLLKYATCSYTQTLVRDDVIV